MIAPKLHPTPRSALPPGVGNPNVDHQSGPRRCQKKKKRGHQKKPSLILLEKKEFRSVSPCLPNVTKLPQWVCPVAKTKKNKQEYLPMVHTLRNQTDAAIIHPISPAILANLVGASNMIPGALPFWHTNGHFGPA